MFDLDALIKEYAVDGQEIAGDIFYWYDDDHKNKVRWLLELDARYFYYIQKRCGIDPEDESYNGPDSDLRIVNVDHFAIKKSCKDRVEEFRKLVYDNIDYVYALRGKLDLDELVWPDDGEDDLF